MVYGHRVLSYHAFPIFVGELFDVLASGNWPSVESGAKPFHSRRFANGHGGLDAFPQYPDIFGMREIIVEQQRVLSRIVSSQKYATPALWSQQHWEHAEYVLAVQVA